MSVTIRQEPADSAVATALLQAYFADRARSFPGGTYRPKPADPADLTPPDGILLVASTSAGEPVGCGALRRIGPDRCEVKHLYVAPAGRGNGTGARILQALETVAARSGARDVVLDTHTSLTVAHALYTSRGYLQIPAYNTNPNATAWFRKTLPGGQLPQ